MINPTPPTKHPNEVKGALFGGVRKGRAAAPP